MRESTHLKRARRKRQSGVAAIEFAIVFPVFFLVLYALIGYAFVFLIQSGLPGGGVSLADTESAGLADSRHARGPHHPCQRVP